MRILVLIYEFPPVGGGGGLVAREVCRELVARGHQVTLLSAHYRGLPRQEMVDGVRVVRVPSFRRQLYRADLLAMGGYILAGFLPALRLARQLRPDIIHVHFAVPGGPLAWAVSRLTGVPYLLTAHLGDVPGGVPEKTGRWFRWVYPLTPPIWRDAAQVVAVSQHTRQLVRQHYPVDPQVIYNGVDLKRLDPGVIQAGSPPRIVFAGRFVEQKNPVQIVRTLASLQDLQWNCVMLGDGVLRPQVEAEMATHGLQDRFQFPGWVTPEEVISWFGKSDILFMPSRSEGLPVVGIQAAAMGLAIVCSGVGGFIDIVEPDRNGYLIPPAEQEAFATALRKLISDPQKLGEFRKASRELARRFDLAHVVDLYENVLAQSAAKG